MENEGEGELVKGKIQSGECRSLDGAELFQNGPWGRIQEVTSKSRGSVGMASREEKVQWEWRQPKCLVEAPAGELLLGT